MKFKEYVDQLNEFLEKHPEAADMITIYAIDDEGNAYHEAYFGPTMGVFDGGEFISGDDDEGMEEYGYDECDAVCIN